MLKINKLFSYFILSIVFHAVFFFSIFYRKEKPNYIFAPVDVAFYSPAANFNTAGPPSRPPVAAPLPSKKNVSNIPDSKEQVQVKEPVKSIKDDIFIKKKENSEESKQIEIKETDEKTGFLEKTSDDNSAVQGGNTSLPAAGSVYDTNGGLYTGAFFNSGDFKYPYYVNQIRRKVAAQWHWVESCSNLRVLLYFKVNRNGSVTEISIKESSGNDDYDRNALNTIRRASPFSELPEGYEGDSLGVFFEFKY
ncbi:MAG: TonB family protein [Endomicrobium sp.]|jgi:TonB family protein|nr:TonB family protein [Endomicrobium sp.]